VPTELDVALAAVTDAGALLRRHFTAGVTAEWKGAGEGEAGGRGSRRDPVTVADREAEALVRAHLADAYGPGELVVGEEGEPLAEAAVAGRRRWYVDPLDGTTNFLKGQPRWAVAVAFCDADDRMAAAAVQVPMAGETFSAARGAGATRDGAPIRAAEVGVDEALALFGPLTGITQAVGVIAPRVLSVRVTGSTVADLADVACARADLFLGTGQGRWDLAAGVLLASEAGAVATDLAGGPLLGPATEGLVAAPRVHAALLPPLRAALDPQGAPA